MTLRNQQNSKYLLLGLFFLFFLSGISSAQSLKYAKSLFQNKDWSFVENKGQITQNDVNYYGHQGGVYLYCKPGMISFVFTKSEKDDQISEATGTSNNESRESPLIKGAGGFGHENHQPSKITTSRADLVLINSNPNAQILASDQQEYYENYYTTPNKSGQAGNADSGITNVHTFKTITYKSIYPHIDMLLSCREKGMEYSFVVYPGGKVSDIQMQWEGIEKTKKLKDSRIEYSTALGKIDEGKPISFQGDNRVESDFLRGENKVGFKVGGYDREKVLVIDPTLDWGTYFGGTGGDWASGVSTDSLGNVYVTGCTSGSNGIATSGAYQTSFGGDFDAFLSKFSPAGTLLWATFYGGKGLNYGEGVSTDISGYVYITGFTVDSNGMATKGAYQTSSGGDIDVFLAKFSTTGAICWATYYGGIGPDIAAGISTDDSGNVYITGQTASSNGIANSGAYQTSYAGGNADAFLVKFDSTGARKWSTYFGGTGYDSPIALTTDKNNNVIITGSTTSTSGIATSGAYQPTYAGDEEAFLAKFNSAGNLTWATYFGEGVNEGDGASSDALGNVYITGFTTYSSNLATVGAYQTSYGGGNYDAFLAKFSSSGDLSWATYYGGSGEDNAIGVHTDISGNVYIVGGTESSSGIATTGAYQTSCGVGGSAFLAKFSSIGALSWATYYSGNWESDGIGVALGGNNNVFITGSTGSNSGIATSGAYQTSLEGSGDAFLAKFHFVPYLNDAGISSIQSPKGVFCSGKILIKVDLQNFGSKELDSVKVGWSVNSKTQNPYSWSGKLKPDSVAEVFIGSFSFFSGMDTIRAWTSNPNGVTDSLPRNDSTIIIDTVNAPAASVILSTAICSGDSISIGASVVSGDSYSWVSFPSGYSSTSSNPSVNPTLTTLYTLTETIIAAGCKKSDSVKVTVNPIPVPNPASNQTICYGSSCIIGSNLDSGFTYSWTSNPIGFTSSSANPLVNPTVTTLYFYKEVSKSTGCANFDSLIVKVNYSPKKSILSQDTSVCSESHISLSAKNSINTQYSWTSYPNHYTGITIYPFIYRSSTFYLNAIDTVTNCIFIDSVHVTALPIIYVVPNAVPNQTICRGQTIDLDPSFPPNTTNHWSSIPPGFSNNDWLVSVSPDTNTIYIQTVKNQYGCGYADSTRITVLPLPKAFIISNSSVCVGDSISLGGKSTPRNSYSWYSLPASFIDSISDPKVSPKNSEIYIQTETGPNGCYRTDSVHINVNPRPTADAGRDTSICEGNQVTLGTGIVTGNQYSWLSIPSGFQSRNSNPVVKPIETTIYRLKISNSFGCSDTDSVKVNVIPLPDAHWKLLSDSPLYVFKATDSTEQYYNWQFGDGGNGYNYVVSHQYDFAKDSNVNVLLTVASAFGCSATYDSTIKYRYIPSPNFNIQVFPNPFNENTNIKISLAKPSHIVISIYDEIGKYLGKIVDKDQSTGVTDYGFDAAKYDLGYGVYYIEILVDGKVYVKPVVRVE